MELKERAQRIVVAMQRDMLDRRGFRQNWEAIDDEIRGDILAEWTLIVMKELEATE
jgi:hypothetical protein